MSRGWLTGTVHTQPSQDKTTGRDAAEIFKQVGMRMHTAIRNRGKAAITLRTKKYSLLLDFEILF